MLNRHVWRHLKRVCRPMCRYANTAASEFRTCVVANPFISNRLVIDVLERLPTPFGLLRRDVLVSELKNLYDAVILAAGCQEERKLGIPGEEFTPQEISLLDVVIIGQGNVALDLARIIGKQVESLRTTDISSIALECLANSSVQNIHVIGRRGPVQASWTAKELRECLFSVKSLQPCFETQELVISDVDREELNTSRTTRRCYDLLTKCFAERSVSQQEVFSRKLHLRFLWTPISFQSLDENSELDYAFGKALRFTELRRNRLTGSSGKQKAVLLEDSVGDVNWKQQCELAFRSIGYKGKSFEGVPFDEKAGVVPNKLGRVVSRVEESLNSCEEPASYETGLYVVGWLKRGPTGIIGSNKWDAEETVKAVVDDFLSKLKTKRNVAFVDFKGWKRIDEEERKRGQRRGIEREKILTWEELLELGAVRTTSKAYGKEPELLSKK
ncbi:NADPH:adrenodoxin oxidoreductase, mitochondrial [Galdieria sulphuraria]|nr:NADPH:adrenodoxin oxidoreductase, mitochondrial [Galdieria sulphuraria]